MAAVAGDWVHIWMPRDAALVGLDPSRSYVGWVTTGSGRVVRSPHAFTLEPERLHDEQQ